MGDNKSIRVDFLVSSDLYHLKITDLSNWGVSANKLSVIEITPQGYDEPYFVGFFDKCDTMYDSVSLNFNCDCDDCGERVELPDGIWKITLKASPSSFSKTVYYLKLDKYQRALDKAYIKNINKGCIDCGKKELIDFLYYKELMSALVRSGDRGKAKNVYVYAKKRLEKELNCKDC